jgi:two-component system CheB/CheR fusion protein
LKSDSTSIEAESTKPVTSTSSPDIPDQATRAPVKIVGIGASAGGLEAFEQFLINVPVNTDMGFVLIQHLDPTHDSMLTDILQRHITLKVMEASEDAKVSRNCVYVIPPNRDMTICKGRLKLIEPEQPHGFRMPIDFFLRSLAEDQGEKAIGIILSGTGSDGTLGLRAILGAGGVTLVQEPGEAKYSAMPKSAIDNGFAAHVMPVRNMGSFLANGKTTNTFVLGRSIASDSHPELHQILQQVRAVTGNDFSEYKKSTMGRRVERRMLQQKIEDSGIYVRYLKENPEEVKLLFNDLLINVTSFFRDPEAFEILKRDILPALLANKPDQYVLRIWVEACSTGEEAYSIAMLVHEFLGEANRRLKVMIFATDVDDHAIAVARAGIYPLNISQDVLPERLERFFVKQESFYHISKVIREMVVFAVHNVIKDPPFTKIDLLSCRNLMIYLEQDLQNRLLPILHYALKPGGVLFLSPSESIGNHVELFTPISRKWRFYRKTQSYSSPSAKFEVDIPIVTTKATKQVATSTGGKEPDFAELSRGVLLHLYAPASVVTDLTGNILYVHGDTGKYLRPAPGRASLNVGEMARGTLQSELRMAIDSVARSGKPVVGLELPIDGDETISDRQIFIRFSVRLLPTGANASALLVSFEEVSRPLPPKLFEGKKESVSRERKHIQQLESDLAYTREELEATVEQQQSSNEELKSSNEEMQSTNEELQSVNEELVTVNAELHNKIEQLASMQNDMKNLFDNITVGIIFLNENLAIRRFTREATRIYPLVASDIDRQLGDFKSTLVNDDLLSNAKQVLASLLPSECEVCTPDGQWFLARIQPYRTLENTVEGVVMTFTDISKLVKAHEEVRESRNFAEAIVDTVRQPMIVLDGALHLISASRSFYSEFKVSEAATLGRSIFDLGDGQWDIPALRRLLETIVVQNQSFENYIVEHDFPVIGHRKLLLNGRRIIAKSGDTKLILLAMEEARDEI